MGKEAKLWAFAAKIYVNAVQLPENDYGVYKFTSQFGEAALAWQLNGGLQWKTPSEVINAVNFYIVTCNTLFSYTRAIHALSTRKVCREQGSFARCIEHFKLSKH